MESAKFHLGSDFIEISGPENFVVGQIDKFKNLIESSYEKILNKEQMAEKVEQNVNKVVSMISDRSERTNQMTEDAEFIEVRSSDSIDYQNVFVLDGNNFQITCDVPGNSSSTKMINVVLIYMYAMAKKGIETIAFGELRQTCMNTLGGEFDASNFSKCIDNHKRFFLLLGERQNRTAKLIRPGIKEAEKLINDLNKL